MPDIPTPTAWVRLIVQVIALLITGGSAVASLKSDIAGVQLDVASIKQQVLDTQRDVQNLQTEVDQGMFTFKR